MNISIVSLLLGTPEGRKAQRLPSYMTREEVVWRRNLSEFVRWREEHDGAWPKRGKTASSEEKRMYDWWSQQRAASEGNGTCSWSIQRQAMMDEHSPGWTVNTRDMWEESLRELAAWRKAYPSSWPREDAKSRSERNLARWLEEQKSGYAGERRGAWSQRKGLLITASCPGWNDSV